MIRPILRRDGQYRATIPLDFLLDGELVARILACEFDPDEPRPTRAAAATAVRDQLRRHGVEHWYFVHEGYDEDEWSDLHDWGMDLVRTFWPDLIHKAVAT